MSAKCFPLYSPTSLKAVFSTSMLLLSSLKGKICNTTDGNMLLLKKAIGLILITTNNLAACADNHSDKIPSDWGSPESDCEKRLSSFMELTTSQCIEGWKMFGSDRHSSHADTELKVKVIFVAYVIACHLVKVIME